jgi:hypothetical protein
MKKQSILYLIIILIIEGCASSTQITGSWKNPQPPSKKINSILVTALTDKANSRQTIETDLVNLIQNRGMKGIKSMDVLPPGFTTGKEPDRQLLLDKIKGSNVDAILTVALINKETESRYVPGNYAYQPVTRFGYYGRFWGYYTTWYPTLYAPGYYTDDRTYFLETNLYSVETEDLLWSAQSETYNPGSLLDFSKEYASAILKQMEIDGVITKRKQD